jgi:hypothetical protein
LKIENVDHNIDPLSFVTISVAKNLAILSRNAQRKKTITLLLEKIASLCTEKSPNTFIDYRHIAIKKIATYPQKSGQKSGKKWPKKWPKKWQKSGRKTSQKVAKKWPKSGQKQTKVTKSRSS